MYGIFTYIWVIYGVNVGKYSIHGSYGDIRSIWINFTMNYVNITASVERINILHLGDHSLNLQLDLSCLINPQLLVNSNIFLLSYGDLGTIWD